MHLMPPMCPSVIPLIHAHALYASTCAYPTWLHKQLLTILHLYVKGMDDVNAMFTRHKQCTSCNHAAHAAHAPTCQGGYSRIDVAHQLPWVDGAERMVLNTVPASDYCLHVHTQPTLHTLQHRPWHGPQTPRLVAWLRVYKQASHK